VGREAAKVSVIIPAYNSADYTVETVESVLAQTFRDFELIVVDDGSTDNTRAALAKFGDCITYIYKENGGACSARNLGIRSSHGEFVACLDCDDLWLPEKLERSVAFLQERAELAMVFTPCYLIDEKGTTIGKTNYKMDLNRAYLALLRENYVTAPSVVMRRACLQHIGLFDERIFIPADWDLWLRLAREYSIDFIDEPLSKYRMVSNYTLRNIDQFEEETTYVVEKHFADTSRLCEGDREQILSRLNVIYGALYRDKKEGDKARDRLKRAIRMNPSSLEPYIHLCLSFLGLGTWRFADRVKNRLLGSWMIRLYDNEAGH
jgi:glycosyltransferase involved in cell wall biosynthesis